MNESLSVSRLIQGMRANLGVPWSENATDRLHCGSPDASVTGIITTFAPTLAVLRKAVGKGSNLIICREAPDWNHPLYGRGLDAATSQALARDPAWLAKRELIQSHALAIYQLARNWDLRETDGQLRGLALALGWEGFHQAKGDFRRGKVYFDLPPASLQACASAIQARLKLEGIRVIGKPDARVRKAAVLPGFTLVPAVAAALREPGVDLVVAGEPVEWEAAPYFEDVIASGKAKGMILLGQQASEDPGSGEVARWLKTFISGVPIEWIPAGEPFWVASRAKETQS